MRFTALIWLILIIPFFFCWKRFPATTKIGNILRLSTYFCLIFALVNPEILWTHSKKNLIIIADRSPSISFNNKQKQTYLISQLEKTRPKDCQLCVISFEQNAAVEKSFSDQPLTEFEHPLIAGSSNLYQALEFTLAHTEQHENNHIIILSDGIWTGENPLNFLPYLNQKQIKIDYVDLTSPNNKDLKIIDFQAPNQVNLQEQFILNAWVHSAEETEAEIQLFSNQQLILNKKFFFKKGNNLLTFNDIIHNSNSKEYVLKIITSPTSTFDPIKENNQSRLLVNTIAKRPLLHISPNGKSQFAELLRKSNFLLEEYASSHLPNISLSFLSQYSGIILENIPARHLGFSNMQTIAEWIKKTGNGLLTTGGEQMYGLGGYINTPLEKIFPISMQIRKEQRKNAVGLSVILDRSGSMSNYTKNGIPKMTLAAQGAANTILLLDSQDSISIAAVDTKYHPIIPLTTRDNALKDISKVKKIVSEGGGIFIYTSLFHSIQEVIKMPQKNRFIILFADASDAEEPGQYKELIQTAQEAGITISVVGLGSASDCDAPLLKDIAKLGKGRIFFTNTPEEIPSLFAEEVLTLTQSAFIKDLTPIKITPLWTTISQQSLKPFPQLIGHNLGYLKPNAFAPIVTDREPSTPLVAYWQIGAGRCLSYMGEADGQYAQALALWPSTSDFFSSLASWISSSHNNLPHHMMATSIIKENKCITNLFIDPLFISQDFYTSLPKISYLIEQQENAPITQQGSFSWVEIDQLQSEIVLENSQTIIPIIEINGKPYPQPPICLPRSLEFSQDSPNKGISCLKHLANETGGKEIVDITKQWQNINTGNKWISLQIFFILCSIIFFLLEILQRRTNVFNLIKNKTHFNFRIPKISFARKNQNIIKKKKSPPTPQKQSSPEQTIKNNKIENPINVTENTNSLLSSLHQLRSKDKNK